MGRLDDKVALITGSDSGIGRASAVEFAREGADVVVNYLEDEQGANDTREQVEAQGRGSVNSPPSGSSGQGRVDPYPPSRRTPCTRSQLEPSPV